MEGVYQCSGEAARFSKQEPERSHLHHRVRACARAAGLLRHLGLNAFLLVEHFFWFMKRQRRRTRRPWQHQRSRGSPLLHKLVNPLSRNGSLSGLGQARPAFSLLPAAPPLPRAQQHQTPHLNHLDTSTTSTFRPSRNPKARHPAEPTSRGTQNP